MQQPNAHAKKPHPTKKGPGRYHSKIAHGVAVKPAEVIGGMPPADITPSPRGKRYPEQSLRQAMRGHRRAQGGPGLLNGWQPVVTPGAAL